MVAIKVVQEFFGRHTSTLVYEHIDCLLVVATVYHSFNLSQLRKLFEELTVRISYRHITEI